MAAKLSPSQKTLIAEEGSKFRRTVKAKYDAGLDAAKRQTAAVQAKLREEHKATKSEGLIIGAGSIAAGAVASQVYREMNKRDKASMAKGINYGGAVLGMLLSYYAKPNQAGMRIAGGSLVGLASAQIALDLQNTDLVPGYND